MSPTERGGEGLLPCPFCGGEAELVQIANRTGVRCTAIDCAGSMRLPLPEEDAAALWNRRPPVVHGWPDREAVEDALDVTLHRWRALDADKTEEAVRGFARESVRLLLAALPPDPLAYGVKE